MKKIVLLGDSIRMGYDKYVKEALREVAEVYYPNDNCQYTPHTLRFVHEWKAKGGWPDDVDLVHWNAGLWDVLELFGDEPITSIDYYGEAIFRIHKRLRMLFPKAKLVFATSTAVLERLMKPEFARHNATIERYNARAIEALADTDEVINDLYTLTRNAPDEYHSDFVHYYTDGGTALIGNKVLSVIAAELGITSKEINLEGFERENYSKEKIGF